RLRQLGIERVITGAADLAAIEAALDGLGAGGARPQDASRGMGVREGIGTPTAQPHYDDDAALDARLDAALDGDLGALRGDDRTDDPGSGKDLNADDSDEADAPGRAQVLAVWGPIGAPGRTTVAVNLAA